MPTRWICAFYVLLLLPIASIAGDAIVYPVLMLDNDTRARHGSHTQLSFSAMGKDFTLNLAPSALLGLPADYSINGKQPLPDLLQGTVEGYEQSWARISINDGKPSGYIWVENHLYQLALSAQLPHELAKQLTKDEFASDGQANTQWVLFEPDASFNTRPNSRIDSGIGSRADTLGAVTRAIRVGIAIDTQFDLWHQGRGLAKALEIINGVDGLYQQQLGVAIIVESILEMRTLDTDPLLAIDGKLEDVLLGFRDYRATQPSLTKPLTLVHLFSGHRDPASVVGLGWIDTACRTDGYDLSVSTPFAFDVLLAAHEISHNLGALHDDDARCSGSTLGEKNTLMVEKLNSDTTSTLSPCSLNNMRPSINRNCNLDNIDLALQTSSAAISTNKFQRQITLTINNNDAQRSAQQLQTRTSFPVGSSLSSVPDSCSLDQGALLCKHFDIAALSSKSLSFVVKLQDLPTLRIVSTIELDSISDVNRLNNRSSIDALTESGEAIAQSEAQSDASQGGALGGSGAGRSGLGRTDYVLLLILLIGLHRRCRKHACH